ncbi:PRC-barrel domain-containing protein [Cohnella nanjingensis]|uniref:PRC-barrel domain-containing protein n=1 Tax=Cohnella nanjingensis TaxID=1387779 RepID=A0A7X0RUQ6_9BACL|nr:PRC-barrel domain-containing protein [Cohnella nanjingensis]MBB6673896.1 PRC-barrel domain-containing protein [Cohnella nanjingensis]
MRTLQQMIGLPVLLESGKQVGRVLDVGFDEFWQRTCIVLDTKVWFRKSVRIVKWESVTTEGEDALVIAGPEAIATVHRKDLQRTFHTGLIQLKELPVFTIDGQELGRVSDVYFRKTEGTQIAGYELTDGFLADVFEGRRRLYLPNGPEGVTLGEDAILVPASYDRILEREPNAESDR